MERVLIIGTNGAGKSTFSRRLSQVTGIPLTHLDQLYWQGNWETVPREEFLRKVSAVTGEPQWIIDGNNLRSIAQRISLADTVFWFEISPLRCVLNVLKREFQYRNRARPDMPSGCISRVDLGFLKTVCQFNRKNREQIAKLLLDNPHLQVVHFRNYRQVAAFWKEVEQECPCWKQ